MLKRIVILFMLLSPRWLQAQIIMNVQLPPAGLVQKDQLWNLIITNNAATEFDGKILLNLQDATTGQTVMTASTAVFSLPKGMKVVSSREVQPVQYTYGIGATGYDYLPLGAYIACYSLYRNRVDASEKTAEECVRINITPLSPPLLIAPLDKAVLSTATPQLTWTAPGPLEMFTAINYNVIIAEVLDGQSSAQAIEYNPPLYAKSGIKPTFENYPSTYSPLEAGKTYAWQVTANNELNYRSSTEVWTFTIAKDSASAETKASSYILLKRNKDEAGLSHVTDKLYVKYYSYDKEHDTQVRTLTSDGKLVEEKKQRVLYGDNYLVFSLSQRYRQGQLYILELKDIQGNTYTTLFTIK